MKAQKIADKALERLELIVNTSTDAEELCEVLRAINQYLAVSQKIQPQEEEETIDVERYKE